jgi:hypothetical protein
MGGDLAIARTRRWSDNASGSEWTPTSDSGQVTTVSSWAGTETTWFNVWERDLALSVSDTLEGPAFAGQFLQFDLNKANGNTWTLDAALGTPPPDIIDGGSTFSQFVLNADGENVLLLGVNKGGGLDWAVVDNNGGVLS